MSQARLLWTLARFKLGLWLASGFFASLMFYLMPLLPGLVVRRIFDRLQLDPSAALGPLLAILAGVAVGRMVQLLLAVCVENGVHLYAGTLLRANLLEQVLRQPGARPLPASTGEAQSRLRDDVDALVRFLTWTLDPIGQGVVLLVALLLLARIDARFTLAVFLPLVLVLALVNAASRKVRGLRQAARGAAAEVSGLIGESLAAATAIQVAGAEARVVGRLTELNAERRRSALRDALLDNALRSVSYYAAGISTALLLLVAARAMREGRFSVGDFALFAAYLEWIATVIGMFGHYLTQYRQTGVSITRLTDLMQGAPARSLVRHRPVHLRGPMPALAAPEPADRPFLELVVRGLSCRYPDGGRGIEAVSLRVPAGAFVVVAGPVGAGKSTLLRALLGLLPRQAGTILWNGVAVEDPANFMVPPRCAYTPQVPRLFSESLRDNLLLGLPAGPDDAALTVAIHAAVLENDLAAMADGLDTRLGPRGARLSGGQVQRVAAARMFLRRPQLLVFDDLSSALDLQTEAELWRRLFRGDARPTAATERPTCLVVSHRHAALRRADEILLMDAGRIVDRGRLAALLERSPLMRALWSEPGSVGTASPATADASRHPSDPLP
ncbi:MAG: ABC transporter ATP-binding protein [Chloroflexi bacterium]|nr:ABC transporter ATP-binding protein [Chloroflexota bacterium]